jgi:hypothetical protein
MRQDALDEDAAGMLGSAKRTEFLALTELRAARTTCSFLHVRVRADED